MGKLKFHPLFLSFSCVLFGCSVVVDADRAQCASDADCSSEISGMEGLRCVDGLCEMAGRWDCQGSLDTTTAGQVTMAVQFVELQADVVPVGGVSARLCAALDSTCATPIREGLVGGPDGSMMLDVEVGFRGYLEATVENYIPAIVPIGPVAVSDDVSAGGPPRIVGMFTPENYSFAAMATGIDADLTQAHALIAARPCAGQRPNGLVFDIDRTEPQVAHVYFRGGAPTTAVSETDESGFTGYANLPSGFATLSCHDNQTDMDLGELTFLARGGWFTVAEFDPGRLQ